jgi:hypothetical protein
LERCPSGLRRRSRKPLYGLPVPWVRIPPSPPNAKSFATAELFFCFAFKMDKTDSIGLKDTFLVVNIECDFLQVISFPPFR